MLHRAVPSRRRMQSRLRLGFGGSLARSAAPAGELQTAKRHRNRVRAAGRSGVSGGLGDPIACRTGRGEVRCGFGGVPCVRVPAPLLPTPMPPFAPRPPTATALPPLWASFPPAASTGWSVQPETHLDVVSFAMRRSAGNDGYTHLVSVVPDNYVAFAARAHSLAGPARAPDARGGMAWSERWRVGAQATWWPLGSQSPGYRSPRPSRSRSGGTSLNVPPDPEARPTLVRSHCIASPKERHHEASFCRVACDTRGLVGCTERAGRPADN